MGGLLTTNEQIPPGYNITSCSEYLVRNKNSIYQILPQAKNRSH